MDVPSSEAKHILGKDRLTSSLCKLHEAEWAKREPAIQMLLKLLQNVMKDPGNLKFRRIKRSNKTLQEKLFSVQGCLEILFAAGFEKDGDEELCLPECIDVAWAVEEITSFGSKELMDQLRLERDAKIAATKNGANGEPAHNANKKEPYLQVTDEARALQQLELDRKERAERQKLKQQRQELHKLGRERQARDANEKAQRNADDDGDGSTASAALLHFAKRPGKAQQRPTMFTLESKGKGKGKLNKKKNKNMQGGRGRLGDLGTGSSGRKLGYGETCDSAKNNLRQLQDRDLVAALAASAAEGRCNKVELEARRKLEMEDRHRRESTALVAYREARSRKIAKDCQQAAQLEAEVAAQKFNATSTYRETVSDVFVHEVPADNSCLFHATSFLMTSDSPQEAESPSPESLRSLVAKCIKGDPERWNEVTLTENRTVDDYSVWITDANSWGGFVDLIVLSECFGVQISVISLESLYWTNYPDNAQQYDRRIYLLYDGVHYDAIVGMSPSGDEVRVFHPRDEVAMQKIMELARQLQEQCAAQESTIYRCMDCYQICLGPAELARHCYDTSHCNVAEVNLEDEESRSASEDEEDVEVDENPAVNSTQE